LGYIGVDREPHFDDLDDFDNEFGRVPGEIQKIKNEIFGDFKLDRDIDFGDAITVHKTQGSDYDHVRFVIPEISPFVVRKLLYTAFTRAKRKLHVIVHENLKEELAFEIVKAHKNSAVDQRNTLVYGYKTYPSKPYVQSTLSLYSISLVCYYWQ
jgi:ATP-dependent exoDNAse (exonuclease V) alpha subunit